ncbi:MULTISPECIES: lipase family alpha/beta hydrolase [Vibrio]|uniref:lipase family alpha/beta hydrolase n=1 Tax=Vibrio TaxID=662 RepID=UPI003D13507E
MKWKVVVALGAVLTLLGCSKPDAEPTKSELSNHQSQQVVIVHGLGRSAWSMQTMSDLVSKQGYQVCVVDYPTLRRSIDETLQQSASAISDCITQFEQADFVHTNQSKTHFVGHSLGGLMIRSYLANHPDFVSSKEMGEVVFLGTPNHGSDVADFFVDNGLLSLLGETATSLTTDPNSFPNSLPQPNYEFGVIAGTQSYPVFSGMFDNSNDGLVSVESTKLEGMKDFVEVDIKHDKLRRDPYVTRLILSFISTGTFDAS